MLPENLRLSSLGILLPDAIRFYMVTQYVVTQFEPMVADLVSDLAQVFADFVGHQLKVVHDSPVVFLVVLACPLEQRYDNGERPGDGGRQNRFHQISRSHANMGFTISV